MTSRDKDGGVPANLEHNSSLEGATAPRETHQYSSTVGDFESTSLDTSFRFQNYLTPQEDGQFSSSTQHSIDTSKRPRTPSPGVLKRTNSVQDIHLKLREEMDITVTTRSPDSSRENLELRGEISVTPSPRGDSLLRAVSLGETPAERLPDGFTDAESTDTSGDDP